MAEKELFGNSEQLNDTISRAAVVDTIEGVDWYHINRNGEMVHGANDAERQAWYKAEDIYKAVESVPSAQQWIPCSERLPEEYGEYRITWTTSASKKQFVGDSEYEITSEWDDEHYRFKGEWLLDDYIKNYPDVKVIAWKPIEEPYKENPDAD